MKFDLPKNNYVRLILLFIVIRVVAAILMLVVAHWNSTDAFLRWDGLWYKQLVENGYDKSYPPYQPSAPECNLNSQTCLRNFAFFPVYPVLVKTVSLLGLSTFSSGFIVSNLLYLGTVLLLYKLALQILKSEQKAFIVGLGLLLIPSAYVLGAYMTESTFIFFLVLAYYLAMNKKWLLAGLAGMVLSATRNIGILFAFSYICVWLEQNNFVWHNWKETLHKAWLDKKFLVGLLLIPCGLILFMLFLKVWVGDALGFLHVQVYWRGEQVSVSLIVGFIQSFYVWRYEVNPYNHLYDLSYFIILAGLFITNLKKKWLPLSLSSIIIWVVIPMVSGSTKALPRYAIVLFPIYLFLPLMLTSRKWRIAYFVISGALMLIFSAFYARGTAITI